MGIQVELLDGQSITVSPEGLKRLIEHHRVKCFRRGSGWAFIGTHPIRMADRNDVIYTGPERRYY